MKAEDRADNPAPGSDFNRTSEDATHEALVVLFATQYGMMATPEETEAMMIRAYGRDRLPGTNSRWRSQMGLDETEGMDPQRKAELLAAIDALRAFVESL